MCLGGNSSPSLMYGLIGEVVSGNKSSLYKLRHTAIQTSRVAAGTAIWTLSKYDRRGPPMSRVLYFNRGVRMLYCNGCSLFLILLVFTSLQTFAFPITPIVYTLQSSNLFSFFG